MYHRALEDQPALQGLRTSRLSNVYLVFNIGQSDQPHLCVTVTTTSHPTLLMVPASISPLRSEGEATGTAVGKSRKTQSHSQAWNSSFRQSTRKTHISYEGFTKTVQHTLGWVCGVGTEAANEGFVENMFGNIHLIHLLLFYTHALTHTQNDHFTTF